MTRAVALALVLCIQAGTCSAQCDADYGKTNVCCDQEEVIAAKAPGRKVEKPCPETAPTCMGFTFGQTFGTCLAAAVDSKANDQTGIAIPAEPSETKDTENIEGNTQIEARPKSEAENKADWCRQEYVSAQDCDKWVADQLSRAAARKADRDPTHLKKEDEERDRKDAERDAKRDEEDRKRDEEDMRRDEDERKESGSDHKTNGASVSPLTLSVLSLAAADADAQCDADYGEMKVCCDQQGVIAAKASGRKVEKPCPENAPTCVGFLFGQAFGTCHAAAVGSKTTAQTGKAVSTEASETNDKDNIEGNTQTEASPKSEAELQADLCRRESVSAKDCDKWAEDQLSRAAARKAEMYPTHLKNEDEERDLKDVKRDRKDSERDAKRDEEDRKRDEEDRKRDADDRKRDEEDRKRDELERKHGGSDNGSNGAPVSPPTLSVLLLAAKNTDSDAWQKDLSADERAALQHKLSNLHRKSIKEQDIASQDGPGASKVMQQEYIHKAWSTIAEFKQKAKAARDAKVDSLPANSKTNQGQASNDFDKVHSDTATEPVSLSAAGHLTDKLPLGSVFVPIAFGLFAYFALSALRQRDSQQSVALLQHAAPV